MADERKPLAGADDNSAGKGVSRFRRGGDTAARMSIAAAAARAAGDDRPPPVVEEPPPALEEGEEIIDDAQIDTGGEKIYFRIGEVAQLVGVDAHVLRYWESEFRMKPQRSVSGQRLYKKQDLSKFLRIKTLLHDEGYTIAGARKVLMGGVATGAATADVGRIRDALTRIEALRRRIRAIRDDMEL
jgi:DNA-binding transcriptional MerR regulator